MWRRLVGTVAGLLVLFVGSLAFNAASGQSRWPGPLDFVRLHPWVALLLLIPLAWVGLRPESRSDRAPRPADHFDLGDPATALPHIQRALRIREPTTRRTICTSAMPCCSKPRSCMR
jgi:hypothetical protein